MMEQLSYWILEFGGVIVDFAGDGILAMWNAPTSQPDHAARACLAALAMLNELPSLNERWANELPPGASLSGGSESTRGWHWWAIPAAVVNSNTVHMVTQSILPVEFRTRRRR